MKHINLKKINFLFQGVLHLMLVTVQILGLAGLPWILSHEGSLFYVKLVTYGMIAGGVIILAGIGVAVLFYKGGQKGNAILVLFQSVGAFLSVYLYRDYLFRSANPETASPAVLMLIPYLIAFLIGASLALLYHFIQKRTRLREMVPKI